MGTRALIIDEAGVALPRLPDLVGIAGWGVASHRDVEDAKAALCHERFDVVLAVIGRTRGVTQLCAWIEGNRPDLPFVVLHGDADTETLTEALRLGPSAILPVHADAGTLMEAFERAAQQGVAHPPIALLESHAAPVEVSRELLGGSVAMRDLRSLLRRVAMSDAPVLLSGETGTGKELVARFLHVHGRRRAETFVAVNCAAIPPTLLESELFGHEKAAFTDASGGREGLFVRANRGTLMLDEINSLPLGLQPKLLRALEEGVVRPIGGLKEKPFDARLICATNGDLNSQSSQGSFRADLLHRIDVLRVVLPPLRARGDDVIDLAHRFVDEHGRQAGKHIAGLSSAAIDAMRGYPWPGNVRELRHCMEAAVALATGDRIEVEDLPPEVRDAEPRHASLRPPGHRPTLREAEQLHIERVLGAVQGNKAEAARVLGISRQRLYRRLRNAR